jgi:hypothetical protein
MEINMTFTEDYPELVDVVPMEYQSAIYINCLSREQVREVINENFSGITRDTLYSLLKL